MGGERDLDGAQRVILDLLGQRHPGKTICPSEAARALGGDTGFRPLMPLVRAAAAALVATGDTGSARSAAAASSRAFVPAGSEPDGVVCVAGESAGGDSVEGTAPTRAHSRRAGARRRRGS